jgi:hypothetical protein
VSSGEYVRSAAQPVRECEWDSTVGRLGECHMLIVKWHMCMVINPHMYGFYKRVYFLWAKCL